MRCGRAQQWMTAAVDGELSPRRRRALDRHLAGCEGCRREQVTTERMLAAVAALPMEAEVPARLEQVTLRQVRLLAAAEDETAARRGWWSLRLPAVTLASLAVLALAVGIVREVGVSGNGVPAEPTAPEQVARTEPAPADVVPALADSDPAAPSVVATPPPELAQRPDLFVELPILRNLEKLRNYDAITAVDVGPTLPPDAGEHSNG